MNKEKGVLLLTVLRQYEYFRDELTGILRAAKDIHETCLIPIAYPEEELFGCDREEFAKLSKRMLRIYDKLLEVREIIAEDYPNPSDK